ncbi:MAG: leucyl aminopeptidase, partial [Chloroflexi bacterium]|nr:leucyl aminopeptidase [Chloroflexota bacterium]
MDIRVALGDITQADVDAIVVDLFEGVMQPVGAIDGAITGFIESGEIKGRLGELALIHTLGKMPARRVVVAGLGKQAQFSADIVRRVAAEASRFLRGKGVRRLATVSHGTGTGLIDTEESAQATAEGSILGLYSFRKHI